MTRRSPPPNWPRPRTSSFAGALRERETVEDRANVLGWSLINTGSAASADAEIAALQAVTAADIQRVARRYLTDNRSIAIRYLNADDQNPVTAQSVDVEAPVKVADLAPVGRIFELLPEAQRTPIPAAGPAVELATPAVETFTLSNGLEVYVARKPGLPLISARLGLAAGSADDGAKTGLSVLTAGLLTQGSSGRSAPEIAASDRTAGRAARRLVRSGLLERFGQCSGQRLPAGPVADGRCRSPSGLRRRRGRAPTGSVAGRSARFAQLARSSRLDGRWSGGL